MARPLRPVDMLAYVASRCQHRRAV